ncbi:MAG TPA: hypothetical protein VGH02_01470 [Rhizomicrobium sp.]|jgi:hypothetical protein
MAAPAKVTMNAGPVTTPKSAFKYPSEEEFLVRRLGAAILSMWPSLPPDLQQSILAKGLVVWDRERDVPKLAQKLETFVKRYPGRMS